LDRSVRIMCVSLASAAGAATLIMMAVTLADIVFRKAFRLPIHGHYEMVQLCLVIAVYGGLAETTRRRAHITMDLVDSWNPRLSDAVLKPAATVLTACVLAMVTAGASSQAYDALRHHDITPDLHISLLWFWGPIISGLLGAFVACVSHGSRVMHDGRS
jgi:TRAP-type C4-dicarboxylate transport system permease small subunit